MPTTCPIPLPEERQALWNALEAVYASKSKAVTYATAYASQGLAMLMREEGDNALVLQAQAVLAHIIHWRGPEARATRTALKSFIDLP